MYKVILESTTDGDIYEENFETKHEADDAFERLCIKAAELKTADGISRTVRSITKEVIDNDDPSNQ